MPPRVTKAMKQGLRRSREASKAAHRGALRCPSCDASMAYSEDLVYQRARAGERVIIPRLSGHRCARCGEQLYDAASTRIIGEHVDVAGPRGGYELRITGLSKGKIGFYLKEDVVREMRLAKGQGFLAIPLTRDTMLLERRSAVDAAEAWLRETRAKRKPRPRDAPRAEDLIRAARDAR